MSVDGVAPGDARGLGGKETAEAVERKTDGERQKTEDEERGRKVSLRK